MTREIPDIRPAELWDSPNVDTWRRSLRDQVLENRDRITTSFQGVYDQVADDRDPGAGVVPMDAASNYMAGDYYTISNDGVFTGNPNIPELTGKVGGTGDQIISDGAQWILLAFSGSFLSSVLDDNAAGVITFQQSPKSNTAAVSGDELMRKIESDAGDAAVQANLDTHVGQASIHFADAPADDEIYGRINNAWERIPGTDFGSMYGSADSFTLNATPSVIQGYADSIEYGPEFVGQVNPTAGTITITQIGVYTFTCWVIGNQGNSTKEESIFLWLRIAGGTPSDGDYTIDHESVDTDKTSARSLKVTFTRVITGVPAICSLMMTATAGLGTFSIENTTFEVQQVIG